MKFRVYDNESGEYITGKETMYTGLNMSGELCYINNDGELHAYDPFDYTVERFTGFTDKNGTEIYENSFVSVNGRTGVVEFVDGQWVITWTPDTEKVFNTSLYTELSRCEVTGTVHDKTSECQDCGDLFILRNDDLELCGDCLYELHCRIEDEESL